MYVPFHRNFPLYFTKITKQILLQIHLLDVYVFNIEWLRKVYTKDVAECVVELLVCQTGLVGSNLRPGPEPHRGQPPPSQRLHPPALLGHDGNQWDGGQDNLLHTGPLEVPDQVRC